ncbi:hypothetical protein Zmor_017009 [Zophobas morio]|uniref:Uncharacterized protein n=1 Tax=Zophobas morio TaxID=2755281 RepID=A0AA38MC68_9CUCU|nr:hypothetical protein Zmor_017009 [Zophobas morio]
MSTDSSSPKPAQTDPPQTFPWTPESKQIYSTLRAAQKSATNPADKAALEIVIKKLEKTIEIKITSLIQEAEHLSAITEYQQAYEKFCEALNHAVDEDAIAFIEVKKQDAFNSAKSRQLNAEAVRLWFDDQCGAALDKFEEALNFVNNEFLYNLIEGNIETVNGLMFKKYLKEGTNGMTRVEQTVNFMAKLMQDVAAFKVRFD